MVSVGKLLSSVGNTVDSALEKVNGGVNDFTSFVDNSLMVNANPNTGNNLPSSNVRPNREQAELKRNIIHWFIPEIGVVQMYINPQNIQYTKNKLINKERTKNGFALQYFGEELTTLSITGHTGSSGIEGINVLDEIYRSEQIAFDPMAVQLYAANNDLPNQLGGLLGGGLVGAIGAAVGDALLGGTGSTGLAGGVNSNVPTLASVAFGVEMYYMGWVYRGYFTSMTVTEAADNFLWNYSLSFTVTQKRGYRGNYFGFHRAANVGPSNNVFPGVGNTSNADLGVPLSFKG